MTVIQCPCESGTDYRNCCEPLHKGRDAATPAQLMRARYTGFVFGKSDYLQQTWHESTRPGSLDLEHSPDWCGLQIVDAGEDGERGWVHFKATYRSHTGFGCLEERSDFWKDQGKWYYVSGQTQEYALKPGRNEACPCGSGRKFKRCCAR